MADRTVAGPAEGPRTAGSPTSARRARTFARQPVVEPLERARFAVRIIVILAVVGIAAPAVVSASVAPPVEPPVSLLGAPPSAKPTHRPKATVPPPTVPPPTATPAPTSAPTVAPTPAPTPKPTTPATQAPATIAKPPATAQPAASAQPNAIPAPSAATPLPAGVGPPKPSASTPADAGAAVLSDGVRPESEGTDNTSRLGLALGAAALTALGFWLVIARRRRSRDGGLHGAIGSVTAAPLSIDALTSIPPRLRSLVPDDEANMPRWLRPSVRAERFSGYQSRARATIGGGAPEAPVEAAPVGAVIDLDALFASRRSAESGVKPPNRGTTRRGKTARS